MTAVGPYEILRPFLWIAAVAFLCGFGGYLMLGALAPPPVERAQTATSPWVQTADDGGSQRTI